MKVQQILAFWSLRSLWFLPLVFAAFSPLLFLPSEKMEDVSILVISPCSAYISVKCYLKLCRRNCKGYCSLDNGYIATYSYNWTSFKIIHLNNKKDITIMFYSVSENDNYKVQSTDNYA